MIAFLKKRFTPFMKWFPELKNKEVLKSDIIAWITVALVLVPQSMAYAQLAWLSPIYWLYASFLPVIVASLWWSSRQLATWPVAVVSLLTATALQPLASSSPEWYALYAAFLALLVWIIQLSIWLFKMWKLVDFLSHPVIVWFTNAAAIIIWASQLSKIFWLSFGQKLSTWWILEKAEHQYQEIFNVLSASLTDTNLVSLAIWIWSIISLVLFKKYAKKLPWVLITVVAFTIISWQIWYSEMWKWLVIWKVPEWLPTFSLPFWDILTMEFIKSILPTALTIAIVWFAEAISVAKSMAASSKQSISANQELIWQWLANIVSSLFKWYPVSGSFSRSAVNFSSWARTWFASVVTWIIVALSLLFLTPLLYHLPQATLAAIIMIAVSGLIKIEPVIHAWKIEKHDWIVSVITFIVTLVSAPHLDNWLIVWVFLSLGLYIYRSMSPSFKEVAMYTDWELRDVELYNLKKSMDVWVYKFEWNLYFANCWYFAWKLVKFVRAKPWIKLLLLDIWWADEIDSSWIEVLENLVENFEKSWIKVLISRVRANPMEKFRKSGFLRKFWKENIFSRSRHDALDYAKNTLKMDIDIETFSKYSPLPEVKTEEVSIYKKLINKIIHK